MKTIAQLNRHRRSARQRRCHPNRTIKGNRVSFKNTNAKVTPGQWHTLPVDFTRNQF